MVARLFYTLARFRNGRLLRLHTGVEIDWASSIVHTKPALCARVNILTCKIRLL
jgi:hypothetical protein